MNASNQDTFAYSTSYDPNVALEFFKLYGNLEIAKEGKILFAQGHKGILSFLQSDKMYLLVDGKVTIQTTSGDTIDIEPGEIFGEFTHCSVHNVTAIASSPCKLLTLNESQLVNGFKKNPDFLLMLMDYLIRDMQKPGIQSIHATLAAENKSTKKGGALNAKMLNELKEILGETAHTVVPEKRVIFQKGAAASLMYVILDGYMTVSVGEKIIGRIGPGDIVGEIALVTHHARTASVIAETRCYLLAITSQTLFESILKLPAFGIILLRVLVSR